MNHIEQAIALVEKEIKNTNASCVIYSDNGPDESTLGGTRDGFLSVVNVLLKLVSEFDSTNKNEHWDDQIKNNMLTIPSLHEPYIIGTEIFKEHTRLVA